MPNKKAQRNNKRKTKRAPPKQGQIFTQFDKMINALAREKADCANKTCADCLRVGEMIKYIEKVKNEACWSEDEPPPLT